MALKERVKEFAPELYHKLLWRNNEADKNWGDGWFDDYYCIKAEITDEEIKELEKAAQTKTPFQLCRMGFLNYA